MAYFVMNYFFNGKHIFVYNVFKTTFQDPKYFKSPIPRANQQFFNLKFQFCLAFFCFCFLIFLFNITIIQHKVDLSYRVTLALLTTFFNSYHIDSSSLLMRFNLSSCQLNPKPVQWSRIYLALQTSAKSSKKLNFHRKTPTFCILCRLDYFVAFF